MAEKIVAYYRVSTKGQGCSKLGLEAQKKIVGDYARAKKGKVIAEYTEVESGRSKDRPQLAQAIEYCRKIGATLVIAKLDRLARSVSFLFALKESGVNFVACDLPELNTLTLAVVAGLAQYEAELISARTKAALGAKKARGGKLGSPANLTDAARQKGVQARQNRAREANQRVFAMAQDLRQQGMSYAKIADRLTTYGQTGSKGGKIYPANVRKILRLYS